MSFIVASETQIIGIFPQNGFQTIRPGATVKLVFANEPGHIHQAKVDQILRGVGEGQLGASGTLVRVNSVGLTSNYAASITLPKDLDPGLLRLGMAGVATVFSDHAGPIGTLASILLWVKAYAMYLRSRRGRYRHATLEALQRPFVHRCAGAKFTKSRGRQIKDIDNNQGPHRGQQDDQQTHRLAA